MKTLKIIAKKIKAGDVLRHWNKDVKVKSITLTDMIEYIKLTCVERDHITEEWIDSEFYLYTKLDDPHIKVLTEEN